MNRRPLALLGCLALLTVPAWPASADSTSVAGTNSYKKLVLNNKDDAVLLKMYAPGGKCEVKYVTATFRDKDGTKYTVDGGCYPGATWAKSLVKGQKLVECDGFKLSYNATSEFWKAVVPRTCLKGLADRVKVTSSYVDDYSPTPGEAGPTKYVARG